MNIINTKILLLILGLLSTLVGVVVYATHAHPAPPLTQQQVQAIDSAKGLSPNKHKARLIP